MPQDAPPIPAKRAGSGCTFHRLAQAAMGAMASAMSDRTIQSSETALVLFSGGQDSATCLAWALQRFARVEMLGFDYGQRHAIELECRDRLLDGMKSLRRIGRQGSAKATRWKFRRWPKSPTPR